LLIFLFALTITPQSVCAVQDFVTVTGSCGTSNANFKKVALREALRSAVQDVLGVQVKSETLVKNFQLINDKILTRVDGYVRKWEVLKEENSGDEYAVTIKAWVEQGLLNKDLFMNGIDVEQVYDWAGKPRILVVVNDYIDSKQSITAFMQPQLEGLLKNRGMTILSGEQLKEIKARDVELASKNSNTAIALGKRYGAEIVIVGKTVSAFSRELDVAGFKYYFYTTQFDAKAYRTSNAEILLSKVYTDTKGEQDTSAMGKHDAAVRSISNILDQHAQDIVFNVVKHWYDGMSKGHTYQLIVSGIKSQEVTALTSYLSALQDVSAVHRRSFNRGVAELEVEYLGVQSSLIDALESGKKVPLEVIGDEPFRINLEKRK
jgi:hypothetical protein